MSAAAGYRLAADALLLSHGLFVLFVVGLLPLVWLGHWRGWAWVCNPWLRSAHLAAIVVVALQAWLGRICPLTTWEMALRARAGDATYQGSFVAHWLGELLYYQAPMWVFAALYTGFGLVVAATWWWVRPRPFRRHHE